jgi:predicted RNA binding protein YcfA (HicA-like mRNA interferase family)
VSDQLPEISGKRLIKALEQHGWYVKRIRGSHYVLRHPEIRTRSRCRSMATVRSSRHPQ